MTVRTEEHIVLFFKIPCILAETSKNVYIIILYYLNDLVMFVINNANKDRPVSHTTY